MYIPRLKAAAYGVVVILALCLLEGLGLLPFPSRTTPQYITAVAKLADIEQTVQAIGTLAPAEMIDVGAQVSGQVKSLNVRLGDHVAQGQLIAVIDPMPQVNALRNAEAVLRQERSQLIAQTATLKYNELEFRRQSEMLPQDSTSHAAFDAAEAAVATARATADVLDAQITQAAIAVDTAKVNLGYTRITSPIAGEVIAVEVKQGQTVNALQAAPTIVRVARLDTMTVKAQISEADVTSITPGQKVYFTILGNPTGRYYSSLHSIDLAPESFASDATSPGVGSTSGSNSSSSSNTAVYYDALFDVQNSYRTLRTSMTAQVNVVLAEAKQVVTVPSSALTLAAAARSDEAQTGPVTGTKAALRVVNAAGIAVRRQVLVGINNKVNAQILTGLTAGERVVISGAPEADAEGEPASTARR
jgi:macrolide-specific efflux system membrane fusion protein